MWLVNFVRGKNCLLEKTYRVTVGGRNLPGGSCETTPTGVNPYGITKGRKLPALFPSKARILRNSFSYVIEQELTFLKYKV